MEKAVEEFENEKKRGTLVRVNSRERRENRMRGVGRRREKI